MVAKKAQEKGTEIETKREDKNGTEKVDKFRSE